MKLEAFFAEFSVQRPLSMVTAYDATFASIAAQAGIDVLLVGDSLANVMLGLNRTAEIGMPEMRHHVAAVRRGAPERCVVADLPFGADATAELAVQNSRILIEAGADAVKLEGAVIEAVRAIVANGMAVVGHLGLLPQTATSLRQVGREAQEREALLRDALALQEAGCCALVLEHIPADLGAEVTRALKIPTVGIGAGPDCAGQVLVMHDLLGMTGRKVPPFVKVYADLRTQAVDAMRAYAQDVAEKRFP